MKKLVLIPLAFVAVAATACDPTKVDTYVDSVRHVLDAPSSPAPEPFAEDVTLERADEPDTSVSIQIEPDSIVVTPEAPAAEAAPSLPPETEPGR